MKSLKIGDKNLEIGEKTYLMGVLNLTPDSFYDGGRYNSFEKAVEHAMQMEKEGADIIDIGGESSRPGSTSVPLSAEMSRVIPIIEELSNKLRIPISIDSYKIELVEKALEVGAEMVNDITALGLDKKVASIISDYNVPVCLMHMKGAPSTMQINPSYEDVILEIKSYLKERISYAISCGINEDKIIIDPGLGFGKRTGSGIEDNCEIIKRIPELKSLNFPLLIGASRKAFIGNICGNGKILPPDMRLEGSLAAACAASINGADILRVHDVKETVQCLKMIECIYNK